jgi:hypothetical protein
LSIGHLQIDIVPTPHDRPAAPPRAAPAAPAPRAAAGADTARSRFGLGQI